MGPILTIIISFKVLKGLRAPRQSSQPFVPTEYVKTDYGWSPKQNQTQPNGRPVSASEAYPDLFKQTVKK